MLYRTLLKLKERNGLTDDLKNKIDIFFATGRITEEQYNELMDVYKEGGPDRQEPEKGTGTDELNPPESRCTEPCAAALFLRGDDFECPPLCSGHE